MKTLFPSIVLLAVIAKAQVGMLAALSLRGIKFDSPSLTSTNGQSMLHRYDGVSKVAVTTITSSSVGYSFCLSLSQLS